jgi:hypothetical protein
MKINATPYILSSILRDDIVKNLGMDGIEAVLDWYDSIEEYEFDQSLFWSWTRYSSAADALDDLDGSEFDEIMSELAEVDEDEPDKVVEVDEDELAERCLDKLQDMTSVIPMSNGEVIVCNEF